MDMKQHIQMINEYQSNLKKLRNQLFKPNLSKIDREKKNTELDNLEVTTKKLRAKITKLRKKSTKKVVFFEENNNLKYCYQESQSQINMKFDPKRKQKEAKNRLFVETVGFKIDA